MNETKPLRCRIGHTKSWSVLILMLGLFLTGCSNLMLKEKEEPITPETWDSRTAQECQIRLPLERAFNDFGGHRGGCEDESYGDLPENSLLCLEAGLKGLNGKPPLQEQGRSFNFLEFDVRQTKHGDLVVYHGGDKDRVFFGRHASIPYTGINRDIFETLDTGIDAEKIKVRDLTSGQIRKLYLGGNYCQHVPEIGEYFDRIKQLGSRSMILVEVKDVTCNADDIGASPAHKLIALVSGYERRRQLRNHPYNDGIREQQVGFLVYRGRTGSLGGTSNLACWCNALKRTKLRVYKTGRLEVMREVMDSCRSSPGWESLTDDKEV